MTKGAETEFDGERLVVRIPMRFQRRGGRKRIVAADGSELVPAAKPQPDGTLVKALARAWRWQKLLDAGVHASVTEIAEAERIGKSYVSRILRLALLAPDIVEGIVEGRADLALMLERLERPLPSAWKEQRRELLAADGGGDTNQEVLTRSRHERRARFHDERRNARSHPAKAFPGEAGQPEDRLSVSP